mmetsp:Transcript_37376/g.65332  ORF Transcript_37376/g.65332 Transcript_37376/m.65332 type:complete len:254 (+) Transcript_37376:25-786(+)
MDRIRAWVLGSLLFLAVTSTPVFSFQSPGTLSLQRRRNIHRYEAQEDDDVWDQLDDDERQLRRNVATAKELIRMKQAEDALLYFDKAVQIKENAFLWQRGVLLYLLGKFDEAHDQLSRNIRHYENVFEQPATEERIWMLASEKRGDLLVVPDQQPFSISLEEEELKESRVVLKKAELFLAGEIGEDEVMETIERTKSDYWACYGQYYLGVGMEARNQMDKAQKYIRSALEVSPLKEDDAGLHMMQLHGHIRGW